MDLIQFSDWLSATAFSQFLQTTSWAIPGIQTLHLICLALTFTAALLLALRLAGRGIAAEPLPQLAVRFTRLIWWLLLVLLVSGSLLIVAEPGRTLTNPVFYAKMVLLTAVVLLTLWIARIARREPGHPTVPHRAAAIASILLWVGIIIAGRFIAYYES